MENISLINPSVSGIGAEVFEDLCWAEMSHEIF
jgi:hypothetical protein